MTSNSEQYYENIFVVYFAVNFAGCSDEFHVFFKHFENLQNLIWNISKEKLHIH